MVMGIPTWRARSKRIQLARPFIMGILNVTPDSFSDGGRFESVGAALARAGQMVAEGADGIDVGGQSTRPQGATVVSAGAERARVVPVIRAIRGEYAELPISVDTTKAEVATAALDAGADIINDVSGFRLDPTLGDIVAASGAGVVLMHSRGGIAEMGTYRFAEYERDVVSVVIKELGSAVARATTAGVLPDSIVIDPGLGFAKRSHDSLRVLAGLNRIVSLGYPVLVGVSRKRFVGEWSGVERAPARVAGTVGANVAALMRGARLFRVHDVAPNREALAVAWGVLQAESDLEPPGGEELASGPRSPFPVPGSH